MTESENCEETDTTEEQKASFASICYLIFAVLFVVSHFAHSDDMGFPSKTPFIHMYIFSLATYLVATVSRCFRLAMDEGDRAAVINFALLLFLLFILIFLGAWASAGIELAIMNAQ